MYPSYSAEFFVKCVQNNKCTNDPTPSPGLAVGRPYLHKNTIMWKITEGYYDYQIEWDTDSSGKIEVKVQLEAKKTGQSSYTTAASYTSSTTGQRQIHVNKSEKFPTTQYENLNSLRIKIGLPVKYKTEESTTWNKTWIWSIFDVGSLMISGNFIHILLGNVKHEKITGASKGIYYISDILIYGSGSANSFNEFDRFYSPIACRNDLLRFSSVSKHFSSITNGTEVVKPIIKTDEYGIPSMVVDIGTTKSGEPVSMATHYYLKLNTKIPTTLTLARPELVVQAVRYTDLKDEVIEVPQAMTPLDPNATYYTITWNDNGGIHAWGVNGDQYPYIVYSSEVMKGRSLGSAGWMPFACKEGYYFAGWYTAPSGGTQVSSSTKPTANTTYYARYRQAPVATTNGSNYVTCDSGGNTFLKNDTYK